MKFAPPPVKIIMLIMSFWLPLLALCAVLVCLPGMVIQAALPGSENTGTLKSFAETEMNHVETSKDSFIEKWLADLSTEDEAAELVGGKPSSDEIMMIYSVKYCGYTDSQKLAEKRIEEITRSFYRFAPLKLILKDFDEVVEEHGLTEEQKTIALHMHSSFMYNQTEVSTYFNSKPGKNFGSVSYKEGDINVVYYNQRDARWAGNSYSRGNAVSTIGDSGCAPTCMAMVISTFTGKSVTPVDTCSWSVKHGYRVQGGTSWGFIPGIAKAYGLSCEEAESGQDIVDALADGKLVVSIMRGGPNCDFCKDPTGGHFIVLRGVTSDGKIKVCDSNRAYNNKKTFSLESIWAQHKSTSTSNGFWIISD